MLDNTQRWVYTFTMSQLSEAARILGKVSSKRKTLAARKNAKKGGWPKGKKRKP